MKYIIILLLAAIIISPSKANLTPYENRCPRMLKLTLNLPVILLDLQKDPNTALKTCIIRNMVPERSLLLIQGYFTKKVPKLERYRTNNNPTIIIITKDISPFMIFSPSAQRVLSYHRSFVLIFLTDITRFKCTGGVMNDEDFTALDKFMNIIWHQYRIMHVIITFPVTCQDKLMVYDIKRKTNLTLYDRTINLIDLDIKKLVRTLKKNEGSLTETYPLKAHIFLRYPTSITDCANLHYYTTAKINNTSGFCGLDALVMNDVIQHFKFDIYLQQKEVCAKYGYVVGNNVTGSLGCIVRKELDISFNSRFMTMYSADYVNFIHFVTVDSLCVIVKAPDIIPLWHYVISVYENTLWLLIISLIVSIGMIMWLMSILKRELTGMKRENLFYYIINAFVLTMYGFTLNKKGKWCLFTGTCLCSSIMFMAIYQGHINHAFATLQSEKSITTLNSLYYSDKILHYSPSMREIMKQIQNPEHKAQADFLKRAQFIPESYMPDFILQHSNAALLGRRRDSIIEILSQYTDEANKPLLNIVDESFITYYLSYVAQTGFLFYQELNVFMQRLREAGLPNMYYKWTCNMLNVPYFMPKNRNEPRPFEKITLADCRIAFGILIAGELMSSVIFCIELWKKYK